MAGKQLANLNKTVVALDQLLETVDAACGECMDVQRSDDDPFFSGQQVETR
jgi:hypothetical protein